MMKKLNNKGIAMVLVLLIVLALSLLASGVILITTSEIFVTRNQAYGKEAFYAAEAGLRHAERVLKKLNSRSQISQMYQNNPLSTILYGPNQEHLGYEFTDPSDGSWVHAVIDPATDRQYEVYIANNDPVHETETSGQGGSIPIESDGIFYIRSVGYSYMGTRSILEEEIYLSSPLFDASKDQFGGGAGNINQQKIQ